MDSLKYPYTFVELTEEEKKLYRLLEGLYTEKDSDCVHVVPSNFVAPKPILKYGSEIYNFKPRKDDIWIIGFPRSGTTLMQEILYLLGTNLDYEKAASEIMDVRFPFLEHIYIMDDKELERFRQISERKNLNPEEELSLPAHVRLSRVKGRRFIKSHYGFTMVHPQLLEVGSKVVLMVRNVKDAFLSTFFYPRWNVPEHEIQEKMRSLWLIYKNELTFYGNYFQTLREAWKRKDSKNLLILFYEDVNKDKRGAIRKAAQFLSVSITDEQINKMANHVDIKNFKNNSSVNNDHLVDMGLYVKNEKCSFIRDGKCGSWREIFTHEMNEEFDEWIRDNLRKIPGFVMPECWKEAMDMDMDM